MDRNVGDVRRSRPCVSGSGKKAGINVSPRRRCSNRMLAFLTLTLVGLLVLFASRSLWNGSHSALAAARKVRDREAPPASSRSRTSSGSARNTPKWRSPH